MRLHLTWLSYNRGRQVIEVDYAHPVPGGWLEYRRRDDGVVHWVSSASIEEAWAVPEPDDPDPMGDREPSGLPS